MLRYSSILLCMACIAAAAPSGRVRDLLDRPVPGLTVIYDERVVVDGVAATQSWSDTTDSLGRFAFPPAGAKGMIGRGTTSAPVIRVRANYASIRLPPGTQDARLRVVEVNGRLVSSAVWSAGRGAAPVLACPVPPGVAVAVVETDGRKIALRVPGLGAAATTEPSVIPQRPVPGGPHRLSRVGGRAGAVLRSVTLSGEYLPTSSIIIANPDTSMDIAVNLALKETVVGRPLAVLVGDAWEGALRVPVERLCDNDGYVLSPVGDYKGPTLQYVDSVTTCGYAPSHLYDAEWLIGFLFDVRGTPDELRQLVGDSLGVLTTGVADSMYHRQCLQHCVKEIHLRLADPFVRPTTRERFGQSREERVAEVGALLDRWNPDSVRALPVSGKGDPWWVTSRVLQDQGLAAGIPLYQVHTTRPSGPGSFFDAVLVGDDATDPANWVFIDPMTGALLEGDLVAGGQITEVDTYDVGFITSLRSIGMPGFWPSDVVLFSAKGSGRIEPRTLAIGAAELVPRIGYDAVNSIDSVIENEVVPGMDVVFR